MKCSQGLLPLTVTLSPGNSPSHAVSPKPQQAKLWP